MGTYFVSVHVSKLGVTKGSAGGTLVGLAIEDTGVAVIVQSYVIYNGKEQEGVREVGTGATTIMKFWTSEGYAVDFLIGVAVVVVKSILGGDDREESVLSGGYFEDSCYGNLEGIRPGYSHPLGVS